MRYTEVDMKTCIIHDVVVTKILSTPISNELSGMARESAMSLSGMGAFSSPAIPTVLYFPLEKRGTETGQARVFEWNITWNTIFIFLVDKK